MKLTLSKRQRAVLEVMDKPKIPVEIRNRIGLKKTNNLSAAVKKLVNTGLICCLNPNASVGRLYGLTKKGVGLRKKLGFRDYCQPKNINWYLYGWVVCGKQRKAILRAMMPDIPMSLRTIRERALEHNPRISRTNANDILQLFIGKGIAMKIKQGNGAIFGLTKFGQRIRNS